MCNYVVEMDDLYTCGPHAIGRLLAHIHKYTRRYMSEKLDQYGVGGPTYGFLFYLYHRDGVSEKEITEHMLVDKATTTRAISKLESSGYVRRERDPNDRRSHRVYLTDKAKDLRPKLDQVKKEWVEIVMGDLDEIERRTLLELLTRIEEDLQRSNDMRGGS